MQISQLVQVKFEPINLTLDSDDHKDLDFYVPSPVKQECRENTWIEHGFEEIKPPVQTHHAPTALHAHAIPTVVPTIQVGSIYSSLDKGTTVVYEFQT